MIHIGKQTFPDLAQGSPSSCALWHTTVIPWTVLYPLAQKRWSRLFFFILFLLFSNHSAGIRCFFLRHSWVCFLFMEMYWESQLWARGMPTTAGKSLLRGPGSRPCTETRAHTCVEPVLLSQLQGAPLHGGARVHQPCRWDWRLLPGLCHDKPC